MRYFTSIVFFAGTFFLLVFSAWGVADAAESDLTLSAGGGYEHNVFYSSRDKKGSFYGFFESGYLYKRPLGKSGWDFMFDGFYSGKVFLSETGANDHFASLYMDVNKNFGGWELGVSNDPQYTRFVTSGESNAQLVSGKQRIWSDKVRVYAIFDISDSSEIEGGIGFKKRDYKDSESDYGETSLDVVYRRRLSESTRGSAGVRYERRNFDDRLAVSSTGVETKTGKKVQIRRILPYIKLHYSPDKRSKYSVKYRYKSNDDNFEDWFTYTENSFLGKGSYTLDSEISIEASARLDARKYDKQTGDTGGFLEEKITSVKFKFLAPAGVVPDGSWFLSVGYSGFRSDIKSSEYDNTSLLVGVTVKR
ncbi:MAG: hypothetical protein ACE5FU_03890 [Nitrospinota bacterium]